MQSGNVRVESYFEDLAVSVRSKETSQTPKFKETSQPVRPKPVAVLQKDFRPPTVNIQTSTQVAHYVQQRNMEGNHDSQNDLGNIMQRRTKITAMLVQQNLASSLPVRIIPIFDRDPLQYHSFIRSFERCVEVKTDNASDCLHLLERCTRGQPRDLVKSCQYLPAVQGYQRAKSLLSEHFGNEYKIASAYMDKVDSWPLVKAEDVKSLQAFSLFLTECSNLTQQIKLREKWRNAACDLQEQHGCRARFIDLVNFVEKQVRIASDPLFGNIQDLKLTICC